MKTVRLFVFSILLFVSKSFYGQVIATGAISIYNICGDNGIDGGACDESTMYTVLAPMTMSGSTNQTNNCGGSNASPGCAGCTGSATKDHIQAFTSVWVPPSCVVNIVTEYGAPFNANASCTDSRAEAYSAGTNRPDVLCIQSAGTGVSPAALSVVASTPVAIGDITGATGVLSASAANIGTCSFGVGGNGGGQTLNGGATGLNATNAGSVCFLTGGTGNGDLLCTANGFAGGAAGTWVNLWYMANRSDEIMTYTLTQTSAAGTCSGLGIIVLPVEILGIGAYNNSDNTIMVAWATATETNSNYFMVEYSFDGENFIPYKEVKAAGNSNIRRDYTCLFTEDVEDNRPYFRLKQVDNNGKYKYSQIIALGTSYGALKSKDFTLISYYNGDKSSIVSNFKLDAPAQVSFSLFDISSQEVYASTNQFNEGDNQFLIPAPEVGGVYILVYQNGSSAPLHKKVMVTK